MCFSFGPIRTLLLLCTAYVCLTLPALAQTQDERTQALDIFRRVIAFDTSVEGRQTPEMAAYLASQFRSAGFGEDDVRILTTDGPNGVSSLLVRYRGSDTSRAAILIMGHLDVVPARRPDWERDPFTLSEENGFFYARGAYDNKSSIALIASTLVRMRQRGYRPRRDIVLWLSGDGETAERATTELLSRHRDLLGNVAYALNSASGGAEFDDAGTVSGYMVQNSEMSVAIFTLRVSSEGGHSSRPLASNAIYDMSDALDQVRQARLACAPTMISGGHAINALPQIVELTLNCRFLPGVSPEDVLIQLRRLAGERVSVEPLEPAIVATPSLLSAEVSAGLEAALSAIGHPDIEILQGMGRGATEGRYFRAAGIATFGTSEAFIRPQDDLAHGLNERYPVESFYRGMNYWRVLITNLAGQR